MTKPQKRGARIAMTPDELNEYLTVERTCRVATISHDGPHIAPLWFVWDGSSMWLTSIVKSQRWTDLMRDPRIAIVVDGGYEYNELVGVEIKGRVEVVGEVPRTGEPNTELTMPEKIFAKKYAGMDEMHHDGRHAWVRIVADKITSWDFRKI